MKQNHRIVAQTQWEINIPKSDEVVFFVLLHFSFCKILLQAYFSMSERSSQRKRWKLPYLNGDKTQNHSRLLKAYVPDIVHAQIVSLNEVTKFAI